MAETEKKPATNQEATPAPGAVIAPGAAAPAQESPAPDKPASEPQFTYSEAEDQPMAPADKELGDQSITWTASEFVHHDKSSGWYLTLTVAAGLGAALMYLLTKDFVSVAVVIVAAIFLGIYASHTPRQLEYTLNRRGLSIGGKHYAYDEFKSFSIVAEGAIPGITLMPLKRFAVPTTIYYAPEEEDKILAVLSNRLPYEDPQRDTVENLMRRIRF